MTTPKDSCLTARNVAVYRSALRRELKGLMSGKVRVIPLVNDPAIQAAEGLVRRCAECSADLSRHIEARNTLRAQMDMANLCETLSATAETFDKKTSRDTALVAQRQFLTRFNNCLQFFERCYWALLNAKHLPSWEAAVGSGDVERGYLRNAVRDEALAEGFTEEAYQQLNGAVPEQGRGQGRVSPAQRKAADQLGDFLKKNPRLEKGKKPLREIHALMLKEHVKVTPAFETFRRYIRSAISAGLISKSWGG